MKSEYANLNNHLAEILYNPNISKKSYMIRFKTSYERYEMILSRDDLGNLANLIYDFLEETNDEQDVELY
jgi:hypothetical protein